MMSEDDDVFVVGGGSTSASSTPRETNFSSSSSSSPNAANFGGSGGGGASGTCGGGGGSSVGGRGGSDRSTKKTASSSVLSTGESSVYAGSRSTTTNTNGSNSTGPTRSQQQQDRDQHQRNYHSGAIDADAAELAAAAAATATGAAGAAAASSGPARSSPVRTRRQFFSSGSAPQHYDHKQHSFSSAAGQGGGGNGNGAEQMIGGAMTTATTATNATTIAAPTTSPPPLLRHHGGQAPLCATSSSPTASNHHHLYKHYQNQEHLQIPRGDKSPLRSSLIKDTSRRSASSCKKTVSFSSMPAEKKISNVSDCLVYMQNGCELIKVRSSTRRYRRRFTLDTDCSNLRWSPTNKKPHKAKIAIDTIREVRLGRNTENLRNSDSCFEELTEDCAFSVIWGEDYQCLDLIASTPDEANIWVTGLMALTSGSAPISQQLNHEGAPTLRDRWLEEAFRQACEDDEQQQHKRKQTPSAATIVPAPTSTELVNGQLPQSSSGDLDTQSIDMSTLLDESGVLKLIKRINPRLPASRIKMKIKEYDLVKPDPLKGYLACEEFCEMYKDMATRPEIYFLMVRYANKDYLTTDDLQVFLETEQGMVGVTKDLCQNIIERYEASEMGRRQLCMTVDGFTSYLQSIECDLMDPTHQRVCQDMSQPLNHYFINASHNTYLLDDQMKGLCSADGYIRALKWGCRYLELDVWESEGYEEPVISHGGHGTAGKMPVSKALNAIREYAFETSQYPLILQLEVHLELKMQKLLAEMIKESLGEYLSCNELPDVDKMLCLPSPEQLKKKILLKGRKVKNDFDADGIGDVTDDEDSTDGNKGQRALKKTGASKKRPLCRELSNLISPYFVTCSFKDLQKALAEQEVYEMCSLNESAAMRLAAHATDAFVIYTRRFLTRIFPNSVRVDSSNYNPQEFWNCGCQIGSLNVQTQGLMTDLVKGKFCANGGCGFVLKPMVMRDEQAFFSPRDCLPTLTPQTLHLKVISAHLLPRPRGSTAKGDSLDPFIILEVFGVPADCAEERTKTVRNDGYNPVFDESFQFDINVPELTLIRFLVLDDDFIGDDFIGQYTIPFDCLQSGYRHITLLNCDGEPMEGTTIFLHVAVTNKRGGGKAKRRGMSVRRKRSKVHTGIKLLGVKQLDEMFKAAIPIVSDCVELRLGLEAALSRWQESCGVGPATTIRQGLRLMYARLQAASGASSAPGSMTSSGASTGTPTTETVGTPQSQTPSANPTAQASTSSAYVLEVWLEDGYPCIELRGASVPEVLKKSCDHFQRVLMSCKAVIERSDSLTSKLEEIHRRLSESYDELLAGFGTDPASAISYSSGLRGQRANRASENFAWNLRLVKAQLDMMGKLHNESRDYLKQVQDTGCLLGVLREQCQQPCSHRSTIQANSI